MNDDVSGPTRSDPGMLGLGSLLRKLPIRWRILSIAALNTAVVLLLTLLILDGATQLKNAWGELIQVRRSEQLLSAIEAESGRLQSLIHRYFTQPAPDVLEEIERRRRALSGMLTTSGSIDPSLTEPIKQLATNTERLVAGFDDLRKARVEISETYENQVLKTAREISGLYSIIESTLLGTDALVKPPLGRSREAFSASLVAANAYYLSHSANAAQEAFNGLDMIERTLPVMLDLAANDLQRAALGALRQRISEFRASMQKLTELFDRQAILLRDSVDRSQTEMTATTTALTERIRKTEAQVQGQLNTTLNDVYAKIAIIAIAFLAIIALFGTAIARTVSLPLTDMMNCMRAIVRGKLDAKVQGGDARDELGAMARSIEVFRQNAIAKLRTEDDLRAAKDSAESALVNLREAQKSLIEAEKLAALGGLVAGVAHEVNNPVGISLTVASTLARRCEDFARDVASGDLRRSRLMEFVESTRDASQQLTTNLHRAGELIQSFKQVAVDRSHAERRSFDLREATEQIVASLRPGLATKQLNLVLDFTPGIEMDSYPGPYGQILTNLFINSVTHGFRDGRKGTIEIRTIPRGPDHVLIDYSDNGTGMSEDVRTHAFDPFFTTLRGQGGTGLGLHIVYNIVTQNLGGKIELRSSESGGTRFLITLPRTVKNLLPDDARNKKD